MLLHASQDRVEGSRAQLVSMLRKLFEHPEPIDGPGSGVVEDVDLPEGQPELSIDYVTHGVPNRWPGLVTGASSGRL